MQKCVLIGTLVESGKMQFFVGGDHSLSTGSAAGIEVQDMRAIGCAL